MRGREFAELQAFVTVADQESFTKAAELLRIAPSTLSQTIRELEERIGVSLLSRTTRRVSITSAGARLLARFRPALDEMSAAVEDARDLRVKPRGVVRLHIPRPAYELFLKSHLGRLYHAYPEILLDITVDDRLTNFVAAGFDLSVQLPDFSDPLMIQTALGGPLRHVAIASPGYLDAHGTPSDPADLTNHRCINWRQPGSIDPFHWRFHVHGQWATVSVSGPMVVSHCDVAIAAAVADMGIAFVLESLAREALDNGRLKPTLEAFLPPFPGWRLCRANRAHTTAATLAVIDFLTESCQPASGLSHRRRNARLPA
jgi:DNA-binding transcriptional LysR family regulator